MRAKLGIGPDGKVVLPQREAEALGLAAGDDVELRIARGSFALIAGANRSGQAYFGGSISALSAPEALYYAFTSLKTGVMLFAFGSEEDRKTAAANAKELRRKSIYFRDGQVVFASSSDPSDRLGAVLIRSELVAREDIERCGRLVQSGRPLGQALVDEGVLSAGQLYNGMVLQVREIVLAACLETEGEFTFLEGPFDERNAVRLQERTRDLLLEGMRRIDEFERLTTEWVPDRRALPRPTGATVEGLSAAEQYLLEKVDGIRSVRQVIDQSGLGLFLGTRALATLVQQGALEPMAPAAPKPGRVGAEQAEEEVFSITTELPPPAASKASGPFETYRRIFKRIFLGLVAKQVDAEERLNSYFDRLSEKQRPVFEGVRIGADGEIDVAQVLLNVTADGVYQGAAARARSLEALEAFLAFTLFEVKNCLPKAEAEALLREVGRMQMGKA